MTWTCTCNNVNPDAETKCLKCGDGKAHGLTEEERAVLVPFNAGRRAIGCEEYVDTSWKSAPVTREEAVAFYRASRAPLEARVKELEAQLAQAQKPAE